MFQTPAGNHVFDIPFFVLECAGAVVFILAVAKPTVVAHWVVRWLSVILIVVLPLAWATLFPQGSGVEGAARLILAVPLVATNIMLAFAAFLRTRKR
ncbi:MAG: hypothetical protein U0R19_08565 [Bryobacteraceae bacterium]